MNVLQDPVRYDFLTLFVTETLPIYNFTYILYAYINVLKNVVADFDFFSNTTKKKTQIIAYSLDIIFGFLFAKL